jgi:hypothetical protein
MFDVYRQQGYDLKWIGRVDAAHGEAAILQALINVHVDKRGTFVAYDCADGSELEVK